MANHPFYAEKSGKAIEIKLFMDIHDIIDNIYKLPDVSKEALLHAYTHKSDKKVTFWFGKEGDAIFPLQTLYDNQAGYENIELLEDSALYELSVDKLHNLYLEDIHIANWGRKFAERECIKSEKLFISRQFKTSLERYQELISDYPDILQRVPLGIIASYLGISQVNLSRIRAKIR